MVTEPAEEHSAFGVAAELAAPQFTLRRRMTPQ
jgi:hypothetical protein